MKGHAEGNYLGKGKRTYNITDDCDKMLLDLSLQYGVNKSSVVEIAVREKYLRDIGPWIPLKYPELKRRDD